MQRREFLGMATVGAATLLDGCRRKAAETAGRAEDIRMRVLRHAILAPNSHNVQPWLIEMLPGAGMKLYVDQSRLLPASDPVARQIHISQGTFLELLDIAAREYGHTAKIEYFPDGEYANSVLEERAVAAIALQEDARAAKDPLFAAIAQRRTNKRPYDLKRPPTAPAVAEMQGSTGSASLSWRVIQSDPQRAEVAAVCKDAMAIEVASPERNRETAHWFRFSDGELNQKRDGFGVAQNGTGGLDQWVVETFVLRRDRAADPKGAFARGSVTLAGTQAQSAPLFAAMVTDHNTRLDQVLLGRAYARAQLTATRLGFEMHPLSQALEEYPEMDSLQRRMKRILGVTDTQTVQMLFRLGYAKAVPHTPRRDVSTLIQGRAVNV